MVFAVRGAIQIPEDTENSIRIAATKLVLEMCRKNSLAEDDVVSVLFSMTEDLTAVNPAACLRGGGIFSSTPLLCVQEARVRGGMPRVIRVLLTAEKSGHGEGRAAGVTHVYLDGAEALRPDLLE
jgi:chorismate mutase